MKQLTQITGITRKSHNDTNNAYNRKFSKLLYSYIVIVLFHHSTNINNQMN